VENSTISTSGYAGSNPTPSPMSTPSGQPGTPILQKTQQKAGEMMDQARSQVTSQLEGQKERVTNTLSSMAEALHHTGEQLRQENKEPVGQIAERAAEAVERVTGYLNERDVRQIINSVESYAREQPAVFIGGAFALGLLAARFFKSSSDGDGTLPSTSSAWTDSYAASAPWSPPASAMAPVSTYNTTGSGYGNTSGGSASAATAGGMNTSLSADMDDEEDLVSAASPDSEVRPSDDA